MSSFSWLVQCYSDQLDRIDLTGIGKETTSSTFIWLNASRLQPTVALVRSRRKLSQGLYSQVGRLFVALLCEEVSSSSRIMNASKAQHVALVGPRRDEKVDTEEHKNTSESQ